MSAREQKLQAQQEAARRAEEKRAFKEAQELDSLRRTFRRINKKGDGKLCTSDIMEEMAILKYEIEDKEAALTIWEVDDDNDGAVDWDEFRTMYYRTRADDTGCEPRKLFNVVDFLMLDKNHSGSVDMDECVTLLYSRYSKEQVEDELKAMKADELKSGPDPRFQDSSNEKNVTYAFFCEIHRRCKKKLIGTGIKPGASTVPTVKGLKAVQDPKFAGLM